MPQPCHKHTTVIAQTCHNDTTDMPQTCRKDDVINIEQTCQCQHGLGKLQLLCHVQRDYLFQTKQLQ